MKKLLATGSALATTLSAAIPAFAQEPLNPCAGIGEPFNNLCEKGPDAAGGILGNVLLVLFIIAILVALFYLVWGGIKWITSGGDKAKVDSARQTIIGAIIGLVIVLLAFFVLNLLLNLFGLDVTNLQLPKIF